MSNTKHATDPRDRGFYMPGEWTHHHCCWMAWPARDDMWPDHAATEQCYANVANTIAEFETVKMLVPTSMLASAKQKLGANVDIVEMAIDDSWARDSGPNFLVNPHGDVAGSTWVFNAWGDKYSPYDQDALMGTRILQQAGVAEYTSTLVAEGGGITVDGEGTVITTESCFLNKNRNPGWTKKEVSNELCRTLGAEKVIWIPGDVDELETDGHVDGTAAFVEPGRVVVEVNPDKTDPHHAVAKLNFDALRHQTDAREIGRAHV